MISKVCCKYKIIILVLIVLLPILYLYFFTEMGDRFALYHNYIDLEVKIDNKQLNMAGVKIDYICEPDKVIESNNFRGYRKIENGKVINSVRFKKGLYGINTFTFLIPRSYLNKFDGDIKVNFGQFNTNWWHRNKYLVDVEVKQISENKVNITVLQKLSLITDGKRDLFIDKTVKRTVTPEDNSINISDGP